MRYTAQGFGQCEDSTQGSGCAQENDICLNYHVLAEVETGGRQAKRLLADRDITQYQEQQQPTLELGTLPLSAPPVVIGAGPAGLLAALQLAEHGYKPLLLERGKPVAQRVQDVQRFWQTGEFNPASNVQFGEGGAGTFSDGKLTTGIKDKRCRQVFLELAEHGAPEEILYSGKPHIGTDKLAVTVKNIRKHIPKWEERFSFKSQFKRLINRQRSCSRSNLHRRKGMRTRF